MTPDGPPLRYGWVATAHGRAWIAWTERGVSALSLETDEHHFVEQVRERTGTEPVRAAVETPFASLVRRGVERGDGSGADLSALPEFQRRVLEVTSQIPCGETRSYQWVAEQAGSPRAVRAVGTALARNPIPLIVPCHRVVRSDGSFGEYGMGGEPMKRRLLALEGALTRRARAASDGRIPLPASRG